MSDPEKDLSESIIDHNPSEFDENGDDINLGNAGTGPVRDNDVTDIDSIDNSGASGMDEDEELYVDDAAGAVAGSTLDDPDMIADGG